MVDITVESEVWGHGALAAEGRLEKSSFKLSLSLCFSRTPPPPVHHS